jgi:hypothetical protein
VLLLLWAVDTHVPRNMHQNTSVHKGSTQEQTADKSDKKAKRKKLRRHLKEGTQQHPVQRTLLAAPAPVPLYEVRLSPGEAGYHRKHTLCWGLDQLHQHEQLDIVETSKQETVVRASSHDLVQRMLPKLACTAVKFYHLSDHQAYFLSKRLLEICSNAGVAAHIHHGAHFEVWYLAQCDHLIRERLQSVELREFDPCVVEKVYKAERHFVFVTDVNIQILADSTSILVFFDSSDSICSAFYASDFA